ncbi:MAG TPA: alcohol dehydrogenase catalytic domain-containing protein [Syntrophorhabdaceae bacterium]|nr:alcohol dehydrogenase catalytic domain-containing protein [Syntrophorhabdaceae bacterium]
MVGRRLISPPATDSASKDSNKRMKAIVFDGALSCRQDHPIPRPQDNEALIRVSLAGICNTDMEIIRGYLGFHGIMGHEFVGRVVEAPPNGRGLLGKRVVGEINCGCGVCDFCRAGHKEHCPHRKTLGIRSKNGAFAEFVTLPLSNLHVVPDSISDEEATFTEPLAAAFEIACQVHIKPTDRILVVGDGKLGLLCALVLALTEADVTLTGNHEHKLSIARQAHLRTINRSRKRPHKAEYDLVVEATGRAEGLAEAIEHVRSMGTIVLKSTVEAVSEIHLAPLVVKEITVVGSRCGPFKPALRALTQKRIHVQPLISGIYRFDNALEALHRAQENKSLKIILDFR